MKQVAQKLETSTLIKELLNLELETLETLCPSKSVGHDRALAGLGELMRRIMQLTLTLRDKKDLTLYLHSPESARAWGFPDVVSANFAALLIWSNVRPHRYRQGANYAPLLPPQLDAVDAPPPADVRFVGMSMHDLIAAFCQSTPISPAADFASDDDTATTSPFLRAAARSILRFDPMVFAAGYYDTEEEIANALANESGAFVGFALLQFGFNVMHTYHVMRHRKTVKIILRTEADAGEAELPSAQIANLTTILAASLHCDDTHRVAFYPPEERSKKKSASYETPHAFFIDAIPTKGMRNSTSL